MLDLLLAGDGEKVLLDRAFHVLLVEAARRSRCRACCSPSLRRSTCARTRGGPVAPRRRLGPGKRPFAHREAKAPVEIGKWHGDARLLRRRNLLRHENLLESALGPIISYRTGRGFRLMRINRHRTIATDFSSATQTR